MRKEFDFGVWPVCFIYMITAFMNGSKVIDMYSQQKRCIKVNAQQSVHACGAFIH